MFKRRVDSRIFTSLLIEYRRAFLTLSIHLYVKAIRNEYVNDYEKHFYLKSIVYPTVY